VRGRLGKRGEKRVRRLKVERVLERYVARDLRYAVDSPASRDVAYLPLSRRETDCRFLIQLRFVEFLFIRRKVWISLVFYATVLRADITKTNYFDRSIDFYIRFHKYNFNSHIWYISIVFSLSASRG